MSVFDAVPELLAAVRSSANATAGFAAVAEICARRAPSPNWKLLPTVDIEGDVLSARRWLEKELGARGHRNATAVYLGLDTLNMNAGRGHNVELGTSKEADPDATGTDWAFESLSYGKPHLIRGLVELKATYSAFPAELASFADYAVFLGYSGLVLAFAIEGMRPALRAPSSGRLFVWGFHDGDLFPLARANDAAVIRLARL